MFFGVLSLFENPVERPKRTRPLHKKKDPQLLEHQRTGIPHTAEAYIPR